MQPEEFRRLMPKLQPYTDFLYFHLMGEPLCHPHLEEYLRVAESFGFRVILTTNGTLLQKQQDVLLGAPALHKINISLHAFEANDTDIDFNAYLQSCFQFGKLAEGKVLITYRLWNQGGLDGLNPAITETMRRYFDGEWIRERRGIRIGNRIYLEFGDKFDWPDLTAADQGDRVFCYGLRDQIGILCDGTVVPCCLDHEGDIALGNLFSQELDEILSNPRAQAIYHGFSDRTAIEELCRKCGYARRFQ
jgi:radical SAM protein with 4Fe4S-binding SPASM domain